jgi:hypothetical protein
VSPCGVSSRFFARCEVTDQGNSAVGISSSCTIELGKKVLGITNLPCSSVRLQREREKDTRTSSGACGTMSG